MANTPLADSQCRRDCPLRNALGRKAADLPDLLLRQHRHSVFLALRARHSVSDPGGARRVSLHSVATLRGTISLIIRVRTQEKVFDADTRGVVALVANPHPVRDRPSLHGPSNPVGQTHLSSDIEPSVSPCRPATHP